MSSFNQHTEATQWDFGQCQDLQPSGRTIAVAPFLGFTP